MKEAVAVMVLILMGSYQLVEKLASIIDLTCLNQVDEVTFEIIDRIKVTKHGVLITKLMIGDSIFLRLSGWLLQI